MKRLLLFLLIFWSSFSFAQDIILSNKDTMTLKSTVTKVPLYKSSFIRISGYLDVNTTSYEIKKFNPGGPPPPPANIPPTASAGNNQTIALPVNSVTLDASGSTDQDGSIVAYQWVKNSGTGGSISTPLGQKTAVINLAAGAYSYRVTVTDNSGAQSSAVVNITVNSPPVGNQRPIARAGSDIAIILPINTVSLDASGSSDADGTIVGYLWKKAAGGSSTIQNSNSAKTDVTNLVQGTYRYSVDVTDNNGAIATDEIQIIVNPAIPPPDPGNGTTTNFTVPQIPFSDADLNAPGRGAEQWHDRNDVNLGYTPKDVYYRFVATRIATGQRGVYSWSYLDGLINAAINKKQKFSFGIMTSYPEGTTDNGLVSISGGTASYPTWLQSAMQGEWLINGSWVPNYNDQTYLAWVLELNQAINNHLENTSFNGVKYIDVINSIDIRSYGSWGEWHSASLANNFTVDQYPSGTFPTAASLKKIVDAYVQGFPDIQLSNMLAAFDAGWLNNTNNPPEIAYYVLTQRNSKGPLGWRRDQWGATDNYIRDYLENNNRSFGSSGPFKNLIMARYQTAPVTGEPPSWIPDDYSDLERQIRLYHATSFGNGNYGTNTPNTTIQGRVKASSKACGYRLSVTAGSITTGSNGKISVTWSNSGIAPTYENWNVVYELKNGNTVVWTGTSTFKPRLFLPGTTVHNDTFANIPTGSNTLSVKLVDPTGYRDPLPLAIPGRKTDGSYTLK